MTEQTDSHQDGQGKSENPEEQFPSIQFDSLSEHMKQACKKAGWDKLMPVQARAIPYLLEGRDLMVQSRTGSGKTGAFVLPVLDRIDPDLKSCQALILVPTRELARQVAAEAERLNWSENIRSVAVYGGVGYGAQLKAFADGAQLVIGTPGRVLDHLLRRSFNLDKLKFLILDEADRMLSMGFYPDMKKVKGYLPRSPISAYLFSATYPPSVIRLSGEFLREPQMLSLSRDHVHVRETHHCFYEVPAMEKDRCLVRIIEVENPESAFIFCNTKEQVHYVTAVLQRFGYDADELTADLSQSARERVLGRVRNGELRFLVATDLAARGLDIPELSHVFQYEPPEDPESYIHRAGRTGRAGAAGVAITLTNPREASELALIGRRFEIDLEGRQLPTQEDVAGIVSERLVAVLESKVRSRDSLQVERMQRFIPLARALSQSDDEIALLAMLLDDAYQPSIAGLVPPRESEKRLTKKAQSQSRDSDSRRRRKPRRR